jgi:hypothetical protein
MEPFGQQSSASQSQAPSEQTPRDTVSLPASHAAPVQAPPPSPRITGHPEDPTHAVNATLAFIDSQARVGFQCSIDAGAWRTCQSPVSYGGLGVGEHEFGVRAIAHGVLSSHPTLFDWRVSGQASPENFSISASGAAVGLLYPGASPQTIHTTLTNPNGVPIFLTTLTVTVPSGPPGCESATNIALVQSNVSSAAPVKIPAHGSVTLPAQGHSAPTIALLSLPTDQDACQNARFPLSFTGSAHS